MSIIYYVIDPNGNIYSEDKKTRFTELCGQALHEYMTTHRGITFLKTAIENDIYAVEVPKHMEKEIEAERLHQIYLRGFEEEIQLISMETSTGEDENDTLESFVADEEEDVFARVCKQIDIENLRVALKQLTKKQMAVITMLYLGRYALTEREVAVKMGVSSIAIHKTKQSAIKKLKKFLNS